MHSPTCPILSEAQRARRSCWGVQEGVVLVVYYCTSNQNITILLNHRFVGRELFRAWLVTLLLHRGLTEVTKWYPGGRLVGLEWSKTASLTCLVLCGREMDRRWLPWDCPSEFSHLASLAGQSQESRTSYMAAQGPQRESSRRQEPETSSLSRIGSRNWDSVPSSSLSQSRPRSL